MSLWSPAGLCAVLFSCAVAGGQKPDLREQYGTARLETAQHIDLAINEVQAHHPAAALENINAALEKEPRCATALFWKGLVLKDSGDLDQAVEFLEKAVEIPTAAKDVATKGALELGLLLSEMDKLDESNRWLSRAIVDDAGDRFHLRWKAWKSMAQNLAHQHRNLSAGLAAGLAYDADPQQVDPALAQQYRVQGGIEEFVRVLFLKTEEPPEPVERNEQALGKVELQGDDIAEQVTGLWPDPRGRYVVALVAPNRHYYLISGDSLHVKRVEFSNPVACSCLTSGRLFVVTSKPTELREVEPESGKVMNAWALDEPAPPTTLAAFPSRNLAFYTTGEKLRRLDLISGSVTDALPPAVLIRGDPAEKYLFVVTKFVGPALVTTRYRRVIVRGRMVTIPEQTREATTTTSLFKFMVDPAGLTPMEGRFNVALNPTSLYVSPDGYGVAVPGTGGWRSRDAGSRGGFVVPVFSTNSLDRLRGVFATDSSPLGIAINPVTQQVATVRVQELRVRNATDNNVFSVLGGFNGRCAWTGNGKHLLVAHTSGGLTAYDNFLSAQERSIAATWSRSIRVDTPTPATLPVRERVADALSVFASFQPSDDSKVVRTAISKALAHGDALRPQSWSDSSQYSGNAATMMLTRQFAADSSDDGQSAGVRIYKLRKAAKDHADYPPLEFLLAEALAAGGQSDAARERYLNVIHEDAGRTDLTTRCLNGLAEALHDSAHDMEAAHCLASSLSLDRENLNTRSLLTEELQLLHLDTELKELNESGPKLIARARIPRLPAPQAAAPLHGDVLFERSVGSIVLIRCGDAGGTGICVGDATTILTNQHVIRNGASVSVFPFAMKDGKLEKLPAHPAQVLYASQQQDMAILHIDRPPDTLIPLPVAEAGPRVGQQVFCIGNPGLGNHILEQTMSEGIISATGRIIRGQEFIQHTAAVNPGNSGGPLLDETGQVVGVITLQAALENVSFAIPASRVRQMFDRQAVKK